MSQTETRPNHRPPKERHIDAKDLQEEEKEYLDIYDVSDLLGLHWQTIRRMILDGELPAVKIRRRWRIRKVDLERFTTPK